ncbi:hypothetical protein SASPL_109818 [Salvia splendens]|uniref:Uncharacterized protein n=1 Tax=Salvia splendens TaxID=180675 RepID=A0A8X8YKQ3_SALSN|nr:uncharacterized protein LOC121796387 [Salvia splendens]KAG6431735.1 hypothetical protein SASPL_109818 [Salvia splendens]
MASNPQLQWPSSPSSTDSSSSSGPLYDLADLMEQLPIKRGLSKFYDGKSQTFESLSKVKSVEDLGKREMRRIKSCYKFGPKATIAKRSTKTSCASSIANKTSLFIHG